MGEGVRSFRDLRIWQKGVELVERIYQVTERFPSKETYGLVEQMRRAVASIPCNVAEGFRRKHAKEYKQFLGIALGSCGELETQIEIVRRLGYLSTEASSELIGDLEYICRMTQALIKKL